MKWWRQSEYARTVVFVLALVVGLWELAVRMFGIRTFLLPPPSLVAIEIFKNPGFYGYQSLYTIYITAIGFALAIIFGVGLAIAIVSSKLMDRLLYTLLIASNSVPKVALAPIFVIWLGTGGEPKVAIAALIAVFPIVINTTLGLRAVDPDMIDLARSARAPNHDVMLKIRLPNALPSIFAGAKAGISFALVGTIMFSVVELCERWFLPGHVSQRSARGAHEAAVPVMGGKGGGEIFDRAARDDLEARKLSP